MNEFETCISEWADRCHERNVEIADLRAKLEASEEESASWRKVLAGERVHAQQRLDSALESKAYYQCNSQEYAKDLRVVSQLLATAQATITAKQGEIERLRTVMERAASMAGTQWLEAQLLLAEALAGEKEG